MPDQKYVTVTMHTWDDNSEEMQFPLEHFGGEWLTLRLGNGNLLYFSPRSDGVWRLDRSRSPLGLLDPTFELSPNWRQEIGHE